jgi:hypothetical protein
MTRYKGMTTSSRGEVTTRRENGGDDDSWANADLTGQKMKKIHAVNLAGTDGR